MTCLYCPSEGPYTREHVVPVGLGGDDEDWVLEGAVCETCNTKIFSPLEAKLMRASPVAVARLYRQLATRGRGGKPGTPSLEATDAFFDDESGVLLEQEFRAGGVQFILPQVYWHPDGYISLTASAVAAAQKLLDALNGLGDVLTIVEKVRNGCEIMFNETALNWRDDQYIIGENASCARPSKGAMFLEPLVRSGGKTSSIVTTRVFQRAKGGLVTRAEDVGQVAAFLSLVRNNRSGLDISDGTIVRSANPRPIYINQKFDIGAIDRALTKIGVNLCARLFEVDAVRSGAFDRARNNARRGMTRPRRWRGSVMEEFGKQFPELPHHHLLIVWAELASADIPAHLLIALRFYDALIDVFAVAEGPEALPACPLPIYVVVDYVANKIRRMSEAEFWKFADKARCPANI